MIIDYLKKMIEKIILLDEEYNEKLDKYYEITDDMRQKSKTNNFMKLKIFLIENRKIIGVILLVIFLFQIIDYFNNNNRKTIRQEGGAAGAVAAAASAAPSAAAAASAKGASAGIAAAKSKGTASGAVKGLKGKLDSKAETLKSGKGHYLDKKAGKFGSSVSSRFGNLKRTGFEIADRLKAVAGIYFEVLYTLVMAFLIGITLGPIIMVIVIFFICFFSFRDQIVAIKRL